MLILVTTLLLTFFASEGFTSGQPTSTPSESRVEPKGKAEKQENKPDATEHIAVNTPAPMVTTLVGYITIFGILFGVFAVLLELRSQRSANFVSAWATIVTQLQAEELRAGRWALRRLWLKRIPPDDPTTWTPPESWQGTQDLMKSAHNAYDNFDVAGVMVLHSKIPSLVDVFVAEYQDSIIACWEQGISFFNQRVLELQPSEGPRSRDNVREELYQSFSVLYVMAFHRREARPQSYPFYSLKDRWILHRRPSHWESKARRLREKMISKALRET